MGQWHLSNDICNKRLPTLHAARRKVAGPAGQPPGTVATCPSEVDEIVRKALKPIYDENTKMPKEFAENA